jgi:hypothetical protein
MWSIRPVVVASLLVEIANSSLTLAKARDVGTGGGIITGFAVFERTMFLRKGTDLINHSSWLCFTPRYLGMLSWMAGAEKRDWRSISKTGNLLERRLKPAQG